MSVLSSIDSVFSYIGFLFGAPSISSPLDAPLRKEALSAVGSEDVTNADIGSRWAQRPPLLPLENHLDDLHIGLGMETVGCCDDVTPGSGQIDSFGEIE